MSSLRLAWLLPLAVALVVLAQHGTAFAGGYDTPILYSARHMGMGGTAQAFVDDPSALFHNPAGIANVPFADVLADFSFIIGDIQSSPTAMQSSIDAETTYAPFFLVGGNIRATDWLSFGLAFYPVASAGATYNYASPTGADVEDTTTLLFLELSPGIAFNLPYGINLGAGYRISFVSLERKQGAGLDLLAKGQNFEGFRVGAQWQPIDEFSLGVTYRHKTETKVTDDEGIALGQPANDISTTFILPSKIQAGIRGDLFGLGAAIDFEYTFQSQNDKVDFTGTRASNGQQIVLQNIFEWTDAITLRAGAEYDFDLGVGTLTPRLGYIWDEQVSTKKYPSAFGTPPTDTHTFTTGIGWDGGPWEVNLAYAFRTGETTVKTEDRPQPGEPVCVFCSYPGDYEIVMHGLYVDFNWKFELGDWKIDADPWDRILGNDAATAHLDD